MAQKNKTVKPSFPYGVFFIIFIAELLIGLSAIYAYLFFDGKSEIELIESNTKQYSSTLAEAFAHVAQLSIRQKKNESLRDLFQEKISENVIDEAFFVLSNGRLIVHSDSLMERDLRGNIANDEMTYNIDLILKPAKEETSKILISDYNIISKEPYFNKNTRELIKKYYYKGIESNSWLFSKAVFVKGKAIGTVNFIVSKDKIFVSLKNLIERAKRLTITTIVISFFISLMLSAFIMMRDILKSKNISKQNIYAEKELSNLPEINLSLQNNENRKDDFLQIELIEDSNDATEKIEVIGNDRYIVANIIPEYKVKQMGKKILEAIPSDKKVKR